MCKVLAVWKEGRGGQQELGNKGGPRQEEWGEKGGENKQEWETKAEKEDTIVSLPRRCSSASGMLISSPRSGTLCC